MRDLVTILEKLQLQQAKRNRWKMFGDIYWTIHKVRIQNTTSIVYAQWSETQNCNAFDYVWEIGYVITDVLQGTNWINKIIYRFNFTAEYNLAKTTSKISLSYYLYGNYHINECVKEHCVASDHFFPRWLVAHVPLTLLSCPDYAQGLGELLVSSLIM